jgi:excisionase family DNA binding protein
VTAPDAVAQPSSDSPPESSVISVPEAAALLNVNPKTLYVEIREGRFPAIRLGRAIRISRAVIASILEQGRVTPFGGKNGGKAR